MCGNVWGWGARLVAVYNPDPCSEQDLGGGCGRSEAAAATAQRAAAETPGAAAAATARGPQAEPGAASEFFSALQVNNLGPPPQPTKK